MAKGPRYNVPYRRRREGKTNYHSRRKIVRSRIPRLVIRHSLRYVTAQLVELKAIGDIVITSAHSSELEKEFGWRGGSKNIPASYLTGLICGKRAVAKKITKAILDIGLNSSTSGCRVFAVLKGFVDAGVEVPYNKSILPNEERIVGQHIAKYSTQIDSEKEVQSRIFSHYYSKDLSPKNMPEHFSSTKEKILSEMNK